MDKLSFIIRTRRLIEKLRLTKSGSSLIGVELAELEGDIQGVENAMSDLINEYMANQMKNARRTNLSKAESTMERYGTHRAN